MPRRARPRRRRSVLARLATGRDRARRRVAATGRSRSWRHRPPRSSRGAWPSSAITCTAAICWPATGTLRTGCAHQPSAKLDTRPNDASRRRQLRHRGVTIAVLGRVEPGLGLADRRLDVVPGLYPASPAAASDRRTTAVSAYPIRRTTRRPRLEDDWYAETKSGGDGKQRDERSARRSARSPSSAAATALRARRRWRRRRPSAGCGTSTRARARAPTTAHAVGTGVGRHDHRTPATTSHAHRWPIAPASVTAPAKAPVSRTSAGRQPAGCAPTVAPATAATRPPPRL